MKSFFLALCLCFTAAVSAEDGGSTQISEALGHILGKNIHTMDVEFDIEAVINL